MKEGNRPHTRAAAGRKRRAAHRGPRVARGKQRQEQGTEVFGPEAQRRRVPAR